MFKKTAIVAGLGLAFAATAQAQQSNDKLQEAVVTSDHLVDTYRWEIEADYTHGEYEFDDFDDTEFDSFSVSGSYFLDDVDTTKGPRSEAAFLDHASDISIFYSYAEVDDNGIDVDGDDYGISGRYVTDEAGWIFGASYTRLEPLDAEIDTFTLTAGKYITDNTSLTLTYWNGDADEGGDTDGGAIGLQHFWHLTNGGIKVEANYGMVNVDDADDVDIYNISGTWYVSHDLGFGASFGRFDGFDGLIDAGGSGLEVDQYSVFGEWFITRNIAANLAYTYGEVDDTDIESNAITLGARVRF